jgi:hypothetical protein
MAYRKPKSNDERRAREWHSWIERCRAELAAIGLPAEVYLDETHWWDFLQNGHLDWHESSGFAFDQLSLEQLRALHRFLEREHGQTEHPPLLLGWLRVRLEKRNP